MPKPASKTSSMFESVWNETLDTLGIEQSASSKEKGIRLYNAAVAVALLLRV